MSAVKSEDIDESRQLPADADISSAEAAINARLARKRTKTGCLTCRRRRIKCDEGKPICRNCQKSRRLCEGYNQRVILKPADFQYLGPHGAATITFHTSMLPGVTGPIPEGQLSFGQPELRPRAIAPQEYFLQHEYPQLPRFQQPQGYQGLNQQFQSNQGSQQLYPPPLLQTGISRPPLGQSWQQQPQWGMCAQFPTQEQARSQAQATVPAPHLLPQHSGDVSVPYTTTSQLPPQVMPGRPLKESFQSTSAWPAQPQHIVPVWGNPPAPLEQLTTESTLPWQTRPSRITVSRTETTTTVQEDWPPVNYMPRPELSQPIDQQQQAGLGQLPPKFRASQLYEQSTETGPPAPLPMAASHNVYHEAVPSVQGISPEGMLEEAAIEVQDDNYYDIDQDDDMDLEISARILEHKSQGVLARIAALSGLDASVLDLRGFDTFIYNGILDTYRPERAANPLRNPATARVFAHFITATGPLLTIFVRQTRVTGALHHDGALPLNQQGLWTYIMPMVALHHQGLLQAILAISSLHIAKLQRASETPSLKHYGYALKRIHRSVRNPVNRHSTATLAATLLLGFYEIMAANHTNWNTHLAGARQLVIETDFASMTREFRRMKTEKAIRDQHNPYYTLDMPPLPYSSQPQDVLLDQIPDIDERVVAVFAGRSLQYDQYGQIMDQSKDSAGDKRVPLDMVDYETLKDLFWWYCKQDVYQSIISGNPLLLGFDHWTDCPPRAPINTADAVYGSFDHLIILIARVADFTVRDRKRKLKVMHAQGGAWRPAPGMQMGPPPAGEGPPVDKRGSVKIPDHTAGQRSQPIPQTSTAGSAPSMPFFGMAPSRMGRPSMPSSYQPDDATQQIPTPGASPSDDAHDLSEMTELALQDWQEMKDAANFFEASLGPTFQPLGPEYQIPMDSPFGPVIFYRSWDISCLWAIYNMCLLILVRAHPHMPPAAHMAAGVASYQTRDIVMAIGRIAAGVPMPPPEQPLNPNLAASLCDLALPLFFSGISYQAPDQRAWLVERLYETDRRAGWATAGIIAEGCQTSWIKAAEAGRGPPHERVQRANFGDNRVQQPGNNYQSVHGKVHGPVEEDINDRKFVHEKSAVRLHWAVGILGNEDDLGPET